MTTATEVPSAVSSAQVEDIALHAIDLAAGRLVREHPSNRPTDVWVTAVACLESIRRIDLRVLRAPFRPTGAPVAIADLAVGLVERLERVVHDGCSSDAAGKAACDHVMPLFVSGLLEEAFGLQRSSAGPGRRLPSSGLYCRRNPNLLRRLIIRSWPEATGVAHLSWESPATTLASWEIDRTAALLLAELRREIDHLDRPCRTRSRVVRLAARRLMRRRIKHPSLKGLQSPALASHPWAQLLASEGWLLAPLSSSARDSHGSAKVSNAATSPTQQLSSGLRRLWNLLRNHLRDPRR